MKLYTYDPAPNPKRLTLFMNYKGIHLETEQIDMMQQEQLSPEYRAINPLCTVPALVLDGDTSLTEVVGICTYLEGIYPEKPLMGTEPLEQAQIISWIHYLFNSMTTPIADMLRNASKGFVDRALPGPLDVPQLPELVTRGKLRLDYAWTSLDKALEGREWLATDSPSQADIDLLVNCEFAGWVKQSIPDQCSNLLAWQERAKAEFSPG
jgi:glutathione S-transferase